MDREVCSLILQRWEVIDSLRTDTKDKRTLVEELDCSRSTVNRAVRELESVGIIEYVDGEYTVTSLGQAITEGFDELMTTVNRRLELEPFLQWIPDDSFNLDLKHLRDAELLVPKAGDPYAMINRHVTVLSEADNIQCVLPLVGLHAHEAVHTQVVENRAQGEVIVTSDVTDILLKDPDYAELTEEMVATGRFHLFKYTDQIPYFVGVFDDIVQIGVDEEGEPRALVESENPEVRKWARNKIETYKEQAEPVTPTPEAAEAQL